MYVLCIYIRDLILKSLFFKVIFRCEKVMSCKNDQRTIHIMNHNL